MYLHQIMKFARLVIIALTFCNLIVTEVSLAKGLNMQMSNSYLIANSSNINGQVKLFIYKHIGMVNEIEISNHVSFFQVNENGLFVYKNDQHGWGYGSVFDLKKRVHLASPPSGATDATLSPDGKKILWLCQENTKNILIMHNLETNKERVLTIHSGHINRPAWSPNSNEIAYYYVESGLLLNDAFMLNIITLDDSDNQPKVRRLAPASYQTALIASRARPPQWSPDGARLLFLANYESNDLISAYLYVVNHDGTGLKRVEGSRWSRDGSALLLARRVSLTSKNFVLSRYNLNSSKLTDIDLPFQLPPNIANGAWHPGGKLFAYITNKAELTFVDLTAQQNYNVADVDEYAQLYWLNN